MNLKGGTCRQERVMLINEWRNRKSFSREKAVAASNGNPKRRSRKNSERECFAPLPDHPSSSNFSEENSAVPVSKAKKPGRKSNGKENNFDSGNHSISSDIVSKNNNSDILESGDKSNDSSMNTDLEYSEGDLVWAYICGYPLWPSLITVDPEEGVYTKTRSNAIKFTEI